MSAHIQRIDPLRTTDRITSAYLSYLATTFAPSDPRLRSELEAELRTPGRLARGPIVQASAPYAPGRSLLELIDGGVLHEDLRLLDRAAFPPDRTLHVHQERAVTQIVAGTNTLVATGTGSGKTETFMLPILNALLEERSAGTIRDPGVRALLLYPMNALANDQLKRLRELFAPYPELTFGQYVGTTADDEAKARSAYRNQIGGEPPSNELISRDAMKSRPPHVLLTNFAMLEYLLLRPADSPFFDGATGRHWRFIVLDEVHVYDGAKGAELAMLLRRVRDRVVRSERGRLVCVATSATLGSKVDAPDRLARFANTLFDEDFSANGVVTPERLPLSQGTAAWTLPVGGAVQLRDLVDASPSTAEVASWIRQHWGAAPDHGELSISEYLFRALSVESTVLDIQRLLERHSVDLREASVTVLGSSDRQRDMVALIDLAVSARCDPSSAPLIPARYHLLLRSLENGFLCLHPRHPHLQPRLQLTRAANCVACAAAGTDSLLLETAACRKCGATYAVADAVRCENGDRLTEAKAWKHPDYYLLVGSKLMNESDEDEEVLVPDAADEQVDERTFCAQCGLLAEDNPLGGCGCTADGRAPVVVAHPTRKGEPLRKCIACGGRSTRDIVLRYITGTDAPVAVLATELYQDLPPSTDDRQRGKVGQGRKLLSFADSRQDAAYFAPFLRGTYGRNVQRRLLLDVLETFRDQEAPRFADLIVPLRSAAEKALVLDPDSGAQGNRVAVARWLIREAIGTDRRQSLAGVGLAEPRVVVPPTILRSELPVPLQNLGLEAREIFDLARVLLGSLIGVGAMHLPDGVALDDPEFDPIRRATTVRLLGSDAKHGIASWLPSAGTNRRLDFVRRVLLRTGSDADPRGLLEQLWTKWFTDRGNKWTDVLKAAENRGGAGTVHAIDYEWLEFVPSGEHHHPFRCSTCAQITWQWVAGVCPTPRCDGSLRAVDPTMPNYFADAYRRIQPNAMSVEEHTGQLSSERARDIQQKFLDGDVNTLSCSTTFELGVDVGEVQAVLMRNMPPSPANYVQRAGRAGRRASSTALVVTFAQRRPHDRYFFDAPEQMVDGDVSPPVVSLANDTIVRRHLHAVALADFARGEMEAGRPWARSLKDWVEEDLDGSPAQRFESRIRSHPPALLETARRLCPPEAATMLGIDTPMWLDDLVATDTTSEKGWYLRAVAEAHNDLTELDQQINAAYETQAHPKHISYLQGVKQSLGNRRVIDFLAQRKVLPKYGFPVDVVELDVSREEVLEARHVELQRDLRLALIDFAPGNRLVAAGALWTSTGLKKPPAREFLFYDWTTCESCAAFTQRAKHLGDLTTCGACDAAVTAKGSYVHPVFGFVGRYEGKASGSGRPPRSGTLDTYFSDYAGGEPEPTRLERPRSQITLRTSRQGQISIVNTGGGRGYRLCTTCGFLDMTPAETKRTKGNKPKPHAHPTRPNRECTASTRWTQLGHFFQTDVLEIDLGKDMAGPVADSVLAALIAGTSGLGISSGDIDGVIRRRTGGPSLVLFDTVPGGAGHAMYLKEHVSALLDCARDVAAACECAEDSSCYGCLRLYSNQAVHDLLSRRAALDVLDHV